MTNRWTAILQKVLALVEVQPAPSSSGLTTPCWYWTGPDDGEQGYPRMSLDGSTVKVHRVMFIQFNGYLPPKKHVDHLCRVRRCVNPAHLEAVTHRENQRRKRRTTVHGNVPVVLPNPPLVPGTFVEEQLQLARQRLAGIPEYRRHALEGAASAEQVLFGPGDSESGRKATETVDEKHWTSEKLSVFAGLAEKY